MTSRKQFMHNLGRGLAVALASLSIVGVAYTFAAPTAPPSSGVGVPLPLNVGSTAQVKAGALTVQGLLTASGGVTVPSGGQICFGTSCKTTWSSSVTAASTTLSGTNNINCYIPYNPSAYTSYTYYYLPYGSNQYSASTTSGYPCSPLPSFTITTSAAPGVLLSASANVVCLMSSSSYTYTYPPTTTYPYSGSKYTYALNVGTTVNTDNTATVTGTCPMYGSSYYYTVYDVAYASVNARYIQ